MRQDLLFYNLNSIFMKKLYLFAALAAMLAACSENDLTAEKQVVQQNAEEGAVQFSAYMSRGLTRAGAPGTVTTEKLKTADGDLKTAGFGVFGYYTDGENYSGVTKPNFFYNQQVKSNGTNFTYSPIKYWPNEFGTDAISDQVDRLTFFAYLPWVDVEPLSGVVKDDSRDNYATTNITGMTRNNVTGDPFIKYTATMDADNAVDLCYGVAANDFESSNSTVNQNIIKKGDPYVNVIKPGDNSKIAFDFKHALAQLNVQIDAVVNAATPTTSALNSDYTRIYVRSISFEGITLKGALNLHDGNWYEVDASGSNKISTGSVTVYDGLKDGKEAIGEAKNESPATLNPIIVQSKAYEFTGTPAIIDDTKVKDGVTETPVNLFNTTGDENTPVFVIPTGEKMKVTIVYDVETVDQSLAFYLSDGVTQGSTIENAISKEISAFGFIESGYKYVLKLHLGMRSVEFDASVTKWQDAETAGEADLPSNLQTYEAKKSPAGDATITVPAATIAYQFAVNGLTPNEVVTATKGTGTNAVTAVDVTNTAANSGGVAIVNATISANTTVNNVEKEGAITVTGGTSGKSLVVKLIQKAAPLGLSVAAADQKISGTKNIVLTPGSGITVVWGTDVAAPTNSENDAVKVYKNGTRLTHAGTPSADGQFKWNASDHQIELHTAAKAGDVYTITVKAGDADAETVSFTVKKLDGTLTAFASSNVNYNTNDPSAFASLATTVSTGSDGIITYSIAKKSGSGTTKAEIDRNTGEVTITTPQADDVFTVTATVADGVNYTYADKTKTYTITVVTE
jgi:hypothetical protein